MNRVALSALAFAVIVGPAASALAKDPRLVEVPYDAAKVFVIEGQTKVQATIRFGDDETVENVAIGDSRSWQVTPNKRADLLFIKPLTPRAKTNMTVVTNKHTYLFDLVASPSADPLYVLSFTYPKDEAAKKLAQKQAEGPNAIEIAAAKDPYAVVDPAALNFAWKASGDSALLPSRIFDDGEATYLSWPEDRSIPAILVTNSEGTEGPVNFTVRGDTIIIPQVPSEIVFRSGDNHAVLTNTGPERPTRQASEADAALASAAEVN